MTDTLDTLPRPAADRLIEKYGGPVPRYTSYPTAPHFHDGVTDETYAAWLRALPADRPVSLYAHVPFCDTLCWFCGCQTKITRRYRPIAQYLETLSAEAGLVGAALGGRRLPVSHIHWGGGSPTILTPEDIAALAAILDRHFERTEDCVFAVEIDPRGMGPARIDALAAAGLTRASLGLQDVDPVVQRAINRVQPMDETAAVANRLRSAGVKELNIDLMYGLPHQTVDHLRRSIDAVMALYPERIALFGYAHVPWMKTHQKMIPTEALPDSETRYEQARVAAETLEAIGYVRIGLDHFARPDDPMARAYAAGTLRRNFQGYTTDDATALIGLGASAIGRTPDGYVQNATATPDYARMVAAGRLPTVRGKALEGDDALMGAVIERLMCDFAVDLGAMADRFDAPYRLFDRAIGELAPLVRDGLVTVDGGMVRITETGRPFVRRVAACFDRYLPTGAGRHSAAV